MSTRGGYFSTDRIITLTDGVIAIVITLLVLELSIPVVSELQDSDGLWPEVRHLWREYLAYVVSFLIVGILWLYHHTVYRRIRSADGTLISLNIFFLMTVSIMPFTSALVAKNSDERLAAIIYGASLFLSALMLAGMFFYASWKRRLVDPDLPAAFIKRENISAAVILVVLATATFLGFWTPYSTYIILTVLVLYYWATTLMNREGVSATPHRD
ncbi:DUF1211 domain-containing protein [bacterium]|nr:DUF1211 domain-containing protein [bacterium]